MKSKKTMMYAEDIKFEKSLPVPDAAVRKLIQQGAKADIYQCWTCGSCDNECPINIATGRLRPQKIVRMANLGMLDELLHEPEIWHCLSCRRCANICPNAAKHFLIPPDFKTFHTHGGVSISKCAKNKCRGCASLSSANEFAPTSFWQPIWLYL